MQCVFFPALNTAFLTGKGCVNQNSIWMQRNLLVVCNDLLTFPPVSLTLIFFLYFSKQLFSLV